MAEKVYLVDGSGYIFRAFYAVAPLTNREGFPTNALYGFVRMLMKLIKEAAGGHVVVVFDAGRKTFRNELYAAYKANRAECPPDLSKQMPYFREFVRAMGLPVLELPGYEADDVLGTLVDRCVTAGFETTVVSGDKDLLQLVSDSVSVWDTMKDKVYRAAEVVEKFGVPPHLVVEVLGLIGDDSDNIPGLAGVGPKTAAQLIEKFGSVDAVLASKDAIANDSSIRNRKKIAETIEVNAESARLSRRLVEIDRRAPVVFPIGGGARSGVALAAGKARPANAGQTVGKAAGHGAQQDLFGMGLDVETVTATTEEQATQEQPHAEAAQSFVSLDSLTDQALLEAITWKGPRSAELQELVARFEFGSLLGDLKLAPAPKPKTNEQYHTILAKDFPSWLKRFEAVSAFAFDTETTALDPLEARLIGVSICWSDDEAFYIPLGHNDSSSGERVAGQLAAEDFFAGVRAKFSDPAVEKRGQNLKYDLSVLSRQGLEIETPLFDTMIASYVLAPDRGSHNLTTLAQEFLHRGVIEYEDVTAGLSDFSKVSIDAATQYGCQDAHYAWLLSGILRSQLESADLWSVFEQIEMPLVPLLSRIERVGVCLDTGLLTALSEEFGQKLAAMEGQIYAMAGGDFNINSPKQLAEVLFNRLGLSTKGLKRTKTGVSTDSSVLEKLALEHPLPGLILEYRSIHKLKSTYVDALPAQISPVTGRLHTRLNQAVTGTGRLSSSEPNLQNIPVQTAEGRRIRETFIADPARDAVLISADYSQIELRVLAHLSNDAVLIDSFKHGIDIHAKTAREILGIPADAEITPEQRRMGKTINFGVVYGMSGFRLGRELGIPVSVANGYIENYFGRYSGVRDFFDRLSKDADELGYVKTMFGRKRIIAQIDAGGRDQGFVRRAALNAPIQGSAADLMKLAMLAVDRALIARGLPAKILLQIHDELLLEADRDALSDVTEVVKTAMEGVATLAVPLEVDVGSGKNWQEAHG
ncbi:MAG: DNA polymerase I [Proteobacteria bacterium]|nr:DNA polymerase I [Pseudomonadota bacterium]